MYCNAILYPTKTLPGFTHEVREVQTEPEWQYECLGEKVDNMLEVISGRLADSEMDGFNRKGVKGLPDRCIVIRHFLGEDDWLQAYWVK